MTPTVVESPTQPLVQFYETPVGKKAVMAVTGVILFGFVIVHMIGNLQIFLGAEKFNAYAELLRKAPALLWAARLALVASVVLHVTASVQLWLLKRRARPVDYLRREAIDSTFASRTMLWSGPIIAAFVIYHLMHFTVGSWHPDFQELKPHHNAVVGFRSAPVAIFYIVAVAMLGLHLYHGAWSMFQSVGVNHPRYTPLLKRFAQVASVLLSAGFITVPLAVMFGFIS